MDVLSPGLRHFMPPNLSYLWSDQTGPHTSGSWRSRCGLTLRPTRDVLVLQDLVVAL